MAAVYERLCGAPSSAAGQKKPQRQTDLAVPVGAAGDSREAGEVLCGTSGERWKARWTVTELRRCEQDGSHGSDAQIARARRATDGLVLRGAAL
ncbi:hypothetical protein NDU88_003878 [Pleurodeles waltl]|uniref:Uncharacterized protein n=1 Tax=Pleurodeles waltl TaxID=8319 RepID=A0AAV7KXR0_PLEWA|nr:hypothetical protein NDU88_003878 [Pleurodeles waltl]